MKEGKDSFFHFCAEMAESDVGSFGSGFDSAESNSDQGQMLTLAATKVMMRMRGFGRMQTTSQRYLLSLGTAVCKSMLSSWGTVLLHA